ncbi:MAG: PQQ-binding-like beta-propeller repeat protein [Acidobacteriota bacterium]
MRPVRGWIGLLVAWFCVNSAWAQIGTEKWRFAMGELVISSPAIAPDGTIYVGSFDHNLYAINPDGSEKWRFATGDNVYSSPAIAPDGTIYAGSYDSNVYAVNPDGSEKWRFATEKRVLSSPVIGADGTLYVGSDDFSLYAVNPDGSEKWRFATGDRMRSPAAVGVDGTIYVGSSDFNLYAVNPDGSEKWRFATGDRVWSSPALSPDGTLYVGSADATLYAIESSGGLGDTPWPMFRHDLRHTGRKDPPLCTLELAAIYADGTLRLEVLLGVLGPAVWSISLFEPDADPILLSSMPVQAIDPPVSIPITVPGFPQLGVIGFSTVLRTAEGLICRSFVLLDTGEPALPPAPGELRELFDSQPLEP